MKKGFLLQARSEKNRTLNRKVEKLDEKLNEKCEVYKKLDEKCEMLNENCKAHCADNHDNNVQEQQTNSAQLMPMPLVTSVPEYPQTYFDLLPENVKQILMQHIWYTQPKIYWMGDGRDESIRLSRQKRLQRIAMEILHLNNVSISIL